MIGGGGPVAEYARILRDIITRADRFRSALFLFSFINFSHLFVIMPGTPFFQAEATAASLIWVMTAIDPRLFRLPP